MMAIRDNPLAARSMGINSPIYKAVTFGVSGLYTGIAGALGAIVVQFVAPDSFTIYQSVAFLVGLVVGGVGWLAGAFFRAAFILFVPNVAEHDSISVISMATIGSAALPSRKSSVIGCRTRRGTSRACG
jgi:branched-chain amino acid transport system permease protein